MGEQEIGRHKGAIETLLHEKKELSRLLQIVNRQMERHLKGLEKQGVDSDEFLDEITGEENQEMDDEDSSNQDVSNNAQSQDTEQERNQDTDSGGNEDFAPF